MPAGGEIADDLRQGRKRCNHAAAQHQGYAGKHTE